MRKNFLLLLWLTMLPLAMWAQPSGVATAPVLASELTWTGSEQALIATAPTAVSGYNSGYAGGDWNTGGYWGTYYNDDPAGFQYYVGTAAPSNGNSGGGQWWSPYTPASHGMTDVAEVKATAPGTYTVWYRIMRDHAGASGNYQTSDWVNAGTVTITKPALAEMPYYVNGPKANAGLIYNDGDQELITAGTEFCTGYVQSPNSVKYVVKTTHALPTTAEQMAATSDIPTGKDAGTYYVYYQIQKDGAYYTYDSPWCEVGVGGITIDKRDITAADFTVTYAEDLTYTGNPQNLVPSLTWTGGIDRTATATPAGKIEYSVQYEEESPVTGATAEGTNAGAYKVQVVITGDANHNGMITDAKELTIKKATLTPSTGTINSPLVYNGTAQNLLTADIAAPIFNGSPVPGENFYYVKGAAAGGTGAYANVTGTDAGEYLVQYHFTPASSVAGNFEKMENQTVGTAKIEKADWTVSATTLTAGWEYDAVEKALIDPAIEATGALSTEKGVVKYYINDGEAIEFDAVKAKNVGDYEVWYEVEGTDNYNAVAKTSLGTVKVSKHGIDVAAQSVSVNWTGTPVDASELIRIDPTDIPAAEAADVIDGLAAALVGFKDGEFKLNDGVNPPVAVTPIPSEAGSYTFVLETKENQNYEINDFVPNGTLTIVKIPATAATVTAATLTYDGSEPELIVVDDATLDGGEMLYFLDEEGAGAPPAGDARWTAEIPTGKDAGDYTVFYMVKGDANHQDVDAVQVDVNIAQKALDIAMFVFDPATLTAEYDGTDLTPAFTIATGEPMVAEDYELAKTNSDGDDVTEMKDVDTYTFTFTGAADGNYTGTVTADFTITAKELADEMFTLSENVTYNGAAQQPTITTKDGEPIVDADYTIEVKDAEGNIVAIDELVNAGTYTFNFIATSDGNYQGAASAEWTIEQKALTAEMFTLSSTEEVYDGTNLMPTFTAADGDPTVLVDADYTVATTNGKDEAVTEMIDADTYTFTFTAAADGNYSGEVTATFVIAQDEAEFELAEANKLTYNGYDQALVTEAKTDAVDGKVEYQILSGEEVVVDWTEDFAAVVAKNAGDYTVKTKFTASDINYSNPEVEEEVAVTINKATIGYSLSNLEKTWDGEPFGAEEIGTLFTLTAGGDGTKLFGDDEYDKPFTLSLPEDYRDAGTYTFKQPKVEFKEGYPVNYNVNFTGEAEVVINKADIKAEDYTAPTAIAGVTYTGEEQDIVEAGEVTTTYQYPEMEEALPIGKMVYATTEDAEEWSETAPKGTEAGGYTVYFKIAGDKNHNDSDPILIEDVEIIQATLTADFLPEEYETELPYKAAAYEAKDFIPALVGIEEAEGYEVYADEMKDAGDYVILFKGINNYQGSFEVPVKVTPIDVIAVAPKGIKKVYDGTASLEGVVKNDDITFVGVLSGDEITVPEALALSTEGIAVSDKPYAITIDAAAINALAENKNYNILEETIDGTLTITKAPAFKVGFDEVPAWSKVFGEEDPELTGYTVAATDGEFFDDIADVLAATTAVRAEGEDVGTYDVTLEIDATAEVFANYEGVEFDGTAAEFEITKSDKVYTVSVANMTETYKGEAFETAITIAPEDLVIAGYEGDLADFFTTLPTATIPEDAKDAGDYNITLTEGESQNYNFTFVPATFTIEPFEVTTATIEAQKVQKGKELDVTKFTITAPEADADLFYVTAPGLVDMDDIVTGDAGVYADGLVIAVDASVADNYVGLDNFTAELEIIAAEAIVLADNEDCKPEAQDGVDVTFASRKLNAGNWNVVALPFEASVAQISDAFGYAAVDVLNESNTKEEEIHFMIISSGKIPAYTPFIVKTTDDEGLKKDNFDQVVFHNVNIEAGDGENKAISDAAGNQFIGTFKAETKIWGEKYRYMAGGAWYNAKNFTESNPAIVKAFRGYIEMVSASARIFIEEPDGTVTAIDAVNFNKAAAEGMYNLSGMKINNTNRKSVVIENGKKVIK